MIDQKTASHELAALLEQHLEEIAESWAGKNYQNAGFRAGELSLDVQRASTTMALSAMIDTLRTGSHTSLKVYLTQLSVACLRSGFENGEVTEFLLVCKDAILPVIRRYSFNLDASWVMVCELDTCLRWMIRQFNTLYAAEMNHRLREQHQHCTSSKHSRHERGLAKRHFSPILPHNFKRTIGPADAVPGAAPASAA